MAEDTSPARLKEMESTDELVSVAQAAKTLGVAQMTIYRWAKADLIESRDVAGWLFIPKSEVERVRLAIRDGMWLYKKNKTRTPAET